MGSEAIGNRTRGGVSALAFSGSTLYGWGTSEVVDKVLTHFPDCVVS